MSFLTLSSWLSKIHSIHFCEIELGLERVKEVADRLDLRSFSCPVIIVGGTNGKGSTVAGLESVYRAAGFNVGSFTSPILFRHNEQVKINGVEVHDELFCMAFDAIEKTRLAISLTSFEFFKLAALFIFKKQALDVILLEVGLGGRLDAVNIIDPALSIVTSIDLDHIDFLGPTRETIGYEKAGIFRAQTPAIYGEKNPPASLTHYAVQINTPLFCQGRDFSYQRKENHWRWEGLNTQYEYLPLPSLMLQNMSTVLMALTLL